MTSQACQRWHRPKSPTVLCFFFLHDAGPKYTPRERIHTFTILEQRPWINGKNELMCLWRRSCSLHIWSSISVSLLDSALAPSILSVTFPPAASSPLRPPRLPRRLQEATDQTWSCIRITILSNYWHFSVWQFWRWAQEERSSRLSSLLSRVAGLSITSLMAF